MLEVTLLALLQGIAEFLPISSSGHLVLGKNLLGLGEAGLRLDVFLHVGTLASIFVFYFKIIRRVIVGREWAYMGKIALSAVPVGVIGLFLDVLYKDAFKALVSSPRIVGGALVCTGIVLTVTRWLPKGKEGVSWWKAFWMGVAQAVAILPGVSRSGMTLAASRLGGVDAERAAEFSFLMSAPPIAGAALLELLQSLRMASGAPEISWPLTVYGCLLAAITGYFALGLLVSSLKGRWFWLFGPYCLLAGLLTIFLIQ